MVTRGSTLTEDQARLLWAHAGGWLLAATIVDPDYGISSLKARAGGKAWPSGAHPELPYNHTSTRANGIIGHNAATGPRLQPAPAVVSVSFTEIRRWTATVPDRAKDELRMQFSAITQERDRATGWCRCPWKDKAPSAHSEPCKRYHPSDTEDERHRGILRGIGEHRDEFVLATLGLTADRPQQLELFGALA